MLYDHKRWDHTETKPDVFSLEGLIAWLEKQPAAGTYDYTDPHGCALCQYFKAAGIHRPSVTMATMWTRNHGFDFPMEMKLASHGHPGEDNRWTFGAALTRAREALSATSADHHTQGE